MSQYRITGTITPDVTGVYNDAGAYGGERYYKWDGGSFYIWWWGFQSQWVINQVVGTPSPIAGFWISTNGLIEGTYQPFGGAGTPVVALEVHTENSYKDVFEASIFAANTFASGAWRGRGLGGGFIFLENVVTARPTASLTGKRPTASLTSVMD